MDSRTVQIPFEPLTGKLRRNTRRNHWRAYRDIRGKCERTILPDGSVVYPYMEYAGKTRFNAYKTRRNSMRAVPFYTKKTFADAPDGIYAWIDSNKGFYAARVLSKTEHGTRHAQIADRVSASEINIAGEIEKTGHNIIFNFYSGTFMWDYMGGETEEELRKEALTLFTSMGLTAEYGKTREELIQNAPTLEELETLKKLGYNVYLYKGKAPCESHGRAYFYGAMSAAQRAEYEAKLADNNAKLIDYQEKIKLNEEALGKFKLAIESGMELPGDMKKQIEDAIPHIESNLRSYKETIADITRARDLYDQLLRNSDRSYIML